MNEEHLEDLYNKMEFVYNDGEEPVAVYAKGRHEPRLFLQVATEFCEKELDVKLAPDETCVYQEHWRRVPAKSCFGYRWSIFRKSKPSRGAFAVTALDFEDWVR